VIEVLQSITWAEWVGAAATITNIWGNLALANLRSRGWMIRLLTNVLFIVYSAHIWGGWPMMANHVTFFVINIVGWNRWRKARLTGEGVK
jgi:thiosulfate reductase cytochrome b subunit